MLTAYLILTGTVIVFLSWCVHHLRDETDRLRKENERVQAWCDCGDSIQSDGGMCVNCVFMRELNQNQPLPKKEVKLYVANGDDRSN